MNTYIVLCNPYAGNGHGEENTQVIRDFLYGEDLTFYDMTKIQNYGEFFSLLPDNNRIILSGGDGTLNRFVNDTSGLDIPQDIYYYAAGSGNDFLRDLERKPEDGPFPVKDYLRSLPEVMVDGKKYKFLNGVGYGIDGYCCQVGDELRAKSDKPVNYAAIAIKGLLFHYKPTNAVVTVDGERHSYQKVWLAPTMNGRFYGGGMMPTPLQNRKNSRGTVSTMVMFGAGKLKTLMIFPSIFKGEHIRHTEMVEILTGHQITVSFDRPTPIQIDGETILGVSSYQVTGVLESSSKSTSQEEAVFCAG